jgi:hypothetical protein
MEDPGYLDPDGYVSSLEVIDFQGVKISYQIHLWKIQNIWLLMATFPVWK